MNSNTNEPRLPNPIYLSLNLSTCRVVSLCPSVRTERTLAEDEWNRVKKVRSKWRLKNLIFFQQNDLPSGSTYVCLVWIDPRLATPKNHSPSYQGRNRIRSLMREFIWNELTLRFLRWGEGQGHKRRKMGCTRTSTFNEIRFSYAPGWKGRIEYVKSLMHVSPSPSAALATHATKRRGSHRYYPRHHLIRLRKVIESLWERWKTYGRLCASDTKIIFCLKHHCIRYLQYTWYCASKTDYQLLFLPPHRTTLAESIAFVKNVNNTYIMFGLFVSTYVEGRSQMTSV